MSGTDPEPSVARQPPVRDPAWPAAVEIFDTTLRDGVQFEGISVTVDDKLRIAEQLDRLGVHWIEGGYPGANPRDAEFFRRAAQELELETATLVAFGSTRRARGRVDEDPTLRNLVAAGTSTVCIVGKSWDYHVTEALRTTLDEGVAMVQDSVEYLTAQGLRVFFDAEHFFDGYKRNPEFALRVLEGAVVAGVDTLVLCDTNGGSLPHEVERIVADVVRHFGGVTIGMHTQNDTGCATANAIAGVVAGATHVQGTINGYGERTGNCDLTQLVPNLTLKMGIATLPEGRIERLTSVSHHVAELVNLPLLPQMPYVGQSAFAHKAGLHTSAIARRPDSYEHVDPAAVGNGTRFLVSDLSGRATIELKAEELGVELDGAQVGQVVEELKELEHKGYHFEVADGSLELLMRRATGWEQTFFELESFRVIVDHQGGGSVDTEATIKVRVGEERIIATGEGNGPVNALDAALRAAIGGAYPELDDIHLVDFKVRVIDTGAGTGAITRVLLDSADADDTWSTIGVSENVIEASWQALLDSLVFGLLRRRG
ncbi:citramalate synthase [Actinomarinicola tropica]|uniref:Citramalate synthase n=1 Tax=Actinomarinicola tropica TaxID=2789776 RepID=A0A5Q2RCT6_9ACTN|nr:citramalate synthase [Actinomarinicola tropica]QGG94699.1 citramalate synthase [Actinomarinicola tropica]